MNAQISKPKKCRNRVKTLDEAGVKLCKEIRDEWRLKKLSELKFEYIQNTETPTNEYLNIL